ncbi:MAG: biotin--[acetyl-CoA-carboxylase] ligase [Anaerolineaceae bacterium]|nr:biotin--[acetyl-CoA-carboxylase] ligase [Anaerolineaceae bacterium]
MLDEKRLRAVLGERPFRWYRETGSTNAEALDWLRQGAATGSLVLADEQSQGRGRLGRGWQTPAGAALALSMVLRPLPQDLPRLTMAGALAIAAMAEDAGATEVSLKWPNDVQVGERKLAGVLSEALWRGDRLVGAVLGMGVNVRVDFRGSALEGRAISLETACGHRLDRSRLLSLVVKHADFWLEQLDGDRLHCAWRQRVKLPARPVEVNGLRGMAEALGRDGALLLRAETGRLHKVYSGEMLPRPQVSDGH